MLQGAGSSSLNSIPLSDWSGPIWAAAALLLTAIVYTRGFLKIRKTRPLLFPDWRCYSFLGSLAVLWLAIASPLNVLNGALLTVHMTQHMILMVVVPPLLLLGAPAVPLLRGLPHDLVRDGLGPFFRMIWLRKLGRFITHPVFAWLVMNVVFVGWHIPASYELAVYHPGWHEVEHLSFLFTNLLFWFPIVQPWPSEPQGSRWLMLPYLALADLVNTAVAAVLTFSPKIIYPSYAAAAPLFGVNPMHDQSAAGALMWTVGSIAYLGPIMWITMHLLSNPHASWGRRQEPQV